MKASMNRSVGVALDAAVAVTALTKDVTDLLNFAPAKAAASMLLTILQTAQGLQTNQSDCFRLASRCSQLLLAMKSQMEGRWDDAPSYLLQNMEKFEATLKSIHDCMERESGSKWHSRLLRKNSIQAALARFHVELDDAARSFQISTLISIHHAVGDRPKRCSSPENINNSEAAVVPASEEYVGTSASPAPSFGADSIPVQGYHDVSAATSTGQTAETADEDLETGQTISDDHSDEFVLVQAPSCESPVSTSHPTLKYDSDISSAIQTELPKFRRYHQSELILQGRSKIKDGWWSGATEVIVDGEALLLKRYEAPLATATKAWQHDVDILRNIDHPNLPRLVGYSMDGTANPFLVLANVKTKSLQVVIREQISKADLSMCKQFLLHFCRNSLSAALHLQQQLDLPEWRICKYFEKPSIRVSEHQMLVIGLPLYVEEVGMDLLRGARLCRTIREIYIQALTPLDTGRSASVPPENEQKITHLTAFAHSLLPDSDESISVVLSRLNDTV